MKEAEARRVDITRIVLLTAEMTALRERQSRLQPDDQTAIQAVFDDFDRSAER